MDHIILLHVDAAKTELVSTEPLFPGTAWLGTCQPLEVAVPSTDQCITLFSKFLLKDT